MSSSCQNPQVTDPDLSSTSEENRFVGNEACASCHGDIYDSYHNTGMGKSISLFDPADAIEKFSSSISVFDPNSNLYYEPFVLDGKLAISEFRLGPDGQKEYERSEFADFVIGSGNATRSYLRNENGLLTEMPLTWYVDRQIWDLSPGYSQNNYRFDRPIDLECLSCHSGPVERSEFTDNHFEAAPQAISCEKCHGQGNMHVENQLTGLASQDEQADIVNPSKLDRFEQMAVCQQCHLTGVSVYKEGESHSTFKPGLLVSANRNVFASEEQINDPSQFGISSHSERLEKSDCFIESPMTCITCHDPHVSVKELDKNWFNIKCQSCHDLDPELKMTSCTDPSGGLDTANCVACHMQKSGTSDIPHVTFTDHWIRRTLPNSQESQNPDFVLLKSDADYLVSISDSPQNDTERALAYFQYYKTRHKIDAYTDSVITLIGDSPDRAESYIALAQSHFDRGEIEKANSIIKSARDKFPSHARVAFTSGIIAKDSQNPDLAIRELQRAVELQAHEPTFASFLGQVLVSSSDPLLKNQGIEVLEKLRTDYPSFSSSALNNLGLAYLQVNQIEKARNPLVEAVNLDPDLLEARVSLAAIALQDGDPDKAIVWGEQALRIDDTNIGALGNLATAYLNKGDLAKARANVQSLLKLYPNNPQARQLLAEIERRS